MNMPHKQLQSGFTLIELVVVIVILGILAATALPKFIDLKSDASTAATAGVAGGLSSAAAVNYSARVISTSHGVSVATCGDVTSAMQSFQTSSYTIAAAGTTAVGVGVSVTCTVNGPNTTTANYIAIGIA